MKLSPELYIGGEFSIDPGNLNGNLQAYSRADLKATAKAVGAGWAVSEKPVRFSAGRFAMLSALDLLVKEGARVLLPDYLCEAQVAILKKYGIEFQFYRLKEDLTPDFESLRKWQNDRVALVVINYFGLLNLETLGRSLRQQFPNAELVADCAQEPFNIPPLHLYRFAYTSLRKVLPVPDGAELYGAAMPNRIDLKVEDSMFVRLKLEAASLKHRYLNTALVDPLREKEFLGAYAAGEEELDGLDPSIGMSATSDGILRTLNRDTIASKRRENYQFLSAGLAGLGIDVPMPSEAAVPLCLPLKMNRRDLVRKALSESGVFTPVHWPAFKELPQESTGRRMAHQEIGLVTDQRYGLPQMERQLAVFREILQRTPDLEVRYALV